MVSDLIGDGGQCVELKGVAILEVGEERPPRD